MDDKVAERENKVMVSLQEVENRLAGAGLHNRYWGRPEMRELTHIIMPDEAVTRAVNGHYEGGFALLVATDRRLLLVDKKPLFLNLHDVSYEMITDVSYSARLLDSTVTIRTVNRVITFTSMRQKHLRQLTSHLQQKVMDIRQFSYDGTRGYSDSLSTNSSSGLQPTFASRPQLASDFQASAPSFQAPTVTFRRRVSRFYPTNPTN